MKEKVRHTIEEKKKRESRSFSLFQNKQKKKAEHSTLYAI
jgi:hypothetical protein